jgi:hypothetical protein
VDPIALAAEAELITSPSKIANRSATAPVIPSLGSEARSLSSLSCAIVQMTRVLGHTTIEA